MSVRNNIAGFFALSLVLPVHAQLVQLTPTNQHPGICTDRQGHSQADAISIESEALLNRPFNSRDYELRLFVCPSDRPQGCFDRRGQSIASSWVQDAQVCSGGPCKFLIKLKQPRSVTVYFKAHIYDKRTGRRVTTPNDSKLLSLTWTTGGACPEQAPPPSRPRTLTLTVNGAKCDVRGSEAPNDVASSRSPTAATVTLSPDGSRGPITIHADMQNWGDTWRLGIGGIGINESFIAPPSPPGGGSPGRLGYSKYDVPGGPQQTCNETSCDLKINWRADFGTNPGEVAVSTIYLDSRGPRDPTGRDRVLAQAECRVNVNFVRSH